MSAIANHSQKTVSNTINLPYPQTPEEQRLLLLKEKKFRIESRRDIVRFAQYIQPSYIVDPVHRIIGDALNKVVNGETKRLMIFAPPQHGKCLDGDAKVLLSNKRTKKIKDVEIGDFVISVNGLLRTEKDIVSGKVFSGVKPCYRIITDDNHKLEGTKDHKIKTPDGWVSIELLSPKNEIGFVKNDQSVRWTKIKSITPIGDKQTYDIETMKNHNFIADGIVCHNSHLTSVILPPFWLGKHPNSPVILASYGGHLAEDKSRQAREVVEGQEYINLFPKSKMRHDSRSIQHWKIQSPYRGSLLAVGVGGPITGHGGLLGIIDDPLENWQTAQSERQREIIWDWYRTTFRTRIRENGAIVIIMTRWHKYDLAGMLIDSQGDDWEILRLPALSETQEERDHNNEYLGLDKERYRNDPLGRGPNELLSPKRFNMQTILELQKDVGSLGWAAEYQGVPRAAEGNRFKRDWFEIVDLAPAIGQRVRYWDFAATKGAGAYTSGALIVKTPDGIYYVEDIIRGQWSSRERNKIMLQTAQLDYDRYGNIPTWFEKEGGSSGIDAAEHIIQMLDGYSVHSDHVTGSKVVRAEPFAAQCEAGNVKRIVITKTF